MSTYAEIPHHHRLHAPINCRFFFFFWFFGQLAKKNLAEAQKLVEKSANDVEKATAEAAAEVYQAIISSVH